MSTKPTKNLLFFTEKLLDWNFCMNKREMPWKFEKDPYKIWLSEIILQQTRVEQGTDYYNKFIKKYPTIQKLAKAKESEVYKMWEGLGYYTRCKNLLATAKLISDNLQGIFPNTFEDIISLKGIGPYTASAIASFAYNLPYAVVDGNVMRVLSRFFGINTPIDSTEGKKIFNELAMQLISIKSPAIYNQAIMDFGATVCKPMIPVCTNCNLSNKCVALKENKINEYPVKAKRIEKKHRWFYYIIIEHNKTFYIQNRTKKDIWQHLSEFFLIEKETEVDIDTIFKTQEFIGRVGGKYSLISVSSQYSQLLTHQKINSFFIHVALQNKTPVEPNMYLNKKIISTLAFPKIIAQFFNESKMWKAKD